MLSAPPCPGLPSCFPFPVIPGAPDGATVLSPCLSLQLSWLPAQGSEPSGYGTVSSGPWGPCLQWHTGVMNQTDGNVWGCFHLATMATNRARLPQIFGGDCDLQRGCAAEEQGHHLLCAIRRLKKRILPLFIVLHYGLKLIWQQNLI